MTAVIRGDALHIPLADASVDLVVTSPPYYALRSYRDGGEHYDGQVGSEPTPQAFLEALWAVTAECWRVLKPSGSMFVNLGDKRAGTGGANGNSGILGKKWTPGDEQRWGPRNNTKQTSGFVRAKSKMLLPHRYAVGCLDGLADPDGIGWIVRQDMVWNKPNGLPESVTDRTRDSHEYWFHMTKQERYFSAVDEIRESSEMRSGSNGAARDVHTTEGSYKWNPSANSYNPLGKLPGSVWTVASEPLSIPEWLGVDHFAAFPQEWPRRLILGWSPSGICAVCGEGRRPVVATSGLDTSRPQARRALELVEQHGLTDEHIIALRAQGTSDVGRAAATQSGTGKNTDTVRRLAAEAKAALGGYTREFLLQRPTSFGYACACTPWRDHPERRGASWHDHKNDAIDGQSKTRAQSVHREPVREYLTDGWTPPSTRPAVILDLFGGTGTVALVARALGRTGISLDLSADYSRLAQWRIFHSGHASKTRERTNSERQGTLL